MSRPTTLPSPWRELADHVGGVMALAAALGVSRRALERWGDGTRRPSAIVRQHVNAFARRRGVAAPFVDEDAAASK